MFEGLTTFLSDVPIFLKSIGIVMGFRLFVEYGKIWLEFWVTEFVDFFVLCLYMLGLLWFAVLTFFLVLQVLFRLLIPVAIFTFSWLLFESILGDSFLELFLGIPWESLFECTLVDPHLPLLSFDLWEFLDLFDAFEQLAFERFAEFFSGLIWFFLFFKFAFDSLIFANKITKKNYILC